MGDASLGGIIGGIFSGKGYRQVRTSPENKLLIVRKGEEVLSIGYSDIEDPSTQDEIEMFSSISESEGATNMLFISPARIPRDLLGVLRAKGAQVWDRTALVLAIGENELRKAALESIEEWDPERSVKGPATSPSPGRGLAPVKELRMFAASISDTRDTNGTKPPLASSDAAPSDPSAGPRPKVRAFPGMGEAPDPPAQATAPAEAPLAELPLPALDEMPMVQTPPGMDTAPAAPVREIAPLRIAREEALSMAPGSVKDLELVYRPCLMLEMGYALRSKDGAAASERTGCFMVDLLDGTIVDLPSTAISDMAPEKEMAPGSRVEGAIVIQTVDGRRAVSESIRVREHVIERKVHDGMMSTIYKETESSVVEGSIVTRSEREIYVPVWKGRLSFGGIVWLMEAYTGSQRRTR